MVDEIMNRPSLLVSLRPVPFKTYICVQAADSHVFDDETRLPPRLSEQNVVMIKSIRLQGIVRIVWIMRGVHIQAVWRHSCCGDAQWWRKSIFCDPMLESSHQCMVRANMKKKYSRSVNIVLCRNGWHRRSHGERRVRGALSGGVFLRESCERCCVSF